MIKNADGRLPDFDYESGKTVDLRDDEEMHVLVEFELVTVKRTSISESYGIRLSESTAVYREPGVYLCNTPSPTPNVLIGGRLLTGDQIVGLNGCSVNTLTQAMEMLKLPRETLQLLVVRRRQNLRGSKAEESSKETTTNPSGQKPTSVASLHTPTHTVYVSPNQLAKTVLLQQRLLEAKLNQDNQDHHHFFESNAKQTVAAVSATTSGQCSVGTASTQNRKNVENFKWVIRRRMDGTRYLTRRSQKLDQTAPPPTSQICQSGSSHSRSLLLGQSRLRRDSSAPITPSRDDHFENFKKMQSLPPVTFKSSLITSEAHPPPIRGTEYAGLHPPGTNARDQPPLTRGSNANMPAVEVTYHPRPRLLLKNRTSQVRNRPTTATKGSTLLSVTTI